MLSRALALAALLAAAGGSLADTPAVGLQRAAELNNQGRAAALAGDDALAQTRFEQALELAAGDPAITATAALNRARLYLRAGNAAALQGDLALAGEAIGRWDESAAAVQARLGLGAAWRDGQKTLGMPPDWRRTAFGHFTAAAQAATGLDDARLESWALGYIGGLYEDEQRYREALAYSRRAAFLAQSVDANEALYLWQWQAARALRALDDFGAARIAYRQAMATLERLRPDLAASQGPGYRERAAPVFFDYADLLLSHTAGLADPVEVERNLREVRATLEQVKVAEVRDYFEDECVAAAEGDTELDAVAGTAAILYPILLPDRTELLVSLPGGLRQFTSPVGAAELTEEVRRFRLMIERYDGRTEFLGPARRLYGWLLEPLEAALATAGIDHLVIVPDGPLRTIPLSSLYDGERFLVERYALATTPGLTLTSPRPLAHEQVQLLAGGLTEAVQGFSPLPNVEAELDSISSEFPAQTIRDEAFVVNEVERRIAEGDQAIVHIGDGHVAPILDVSGIAAHSKLQTNTAGAVDRSESDGVETAERQSMLLFSNRPRRALCGADGFDRQDREDSRGTDRLRRRTGTAAVPKLRPDAAVGGARHQCRAAAGVGACSCRGVQNQRPRSGVDCTGTERHSAN